ncbi:MAG: HNH endonuclease [Geminicoccaceae bacterium]
MIAGPSVDRHHFLPRAEGGRVAAPVHRICHRKLHTLWSERELAQLYATPEAIRSHPEIWRFVRWLRGRPPEFWAPTRAPRGGRR